MRGTLVAVLLLLLAPMERVTAAHPMPNTVIAVSLGSDGAAFDIAVPLPDLKLALPERWPGDVDLLAEPQRSVVAAYFNQHFAVRASNGTAQRFELRRLSIWQADNVNVGAYQEMRVSVFSPAAPLFDARAFTLAYDAVIHQVPTHFAVVQILRDFQGGSVDAERAADVGVIRYDFVHNTTPPLAISLAAGSQWRGFRAAIALGFQHVITGYDHLLFLITLLVVAPLRAQGGRWSLFQGWPFALRRFLGISIAFTVGHSAALFLGTYELLPIPRAAIEIAIAASILVAAIHAIRPLLSGREWAIAGGFGIVHGLAFSESLSGLSLLPWTRALTVFGFNVGVEGAQLAAMACALPIIALSRWRHFHAVRVAAMLGAAAMAVVWLVERSRVLFG